MLDLCEEVVACHGFCSLHWHGLMDRGARHEQCWMGFKWVTGQVVLVRRVSCNLSSVVPIHVRRHINPPTHSIECGGVKLNLVSAKLCNQVSVVPLPGHVHIIK